tara:strand:+ start:1379 stop:2440 length:1062 start_codon:yes stop_codon:yes gene_type:complete
MTLKILYGVQGTGNGHLARTRALLPALKNKDVEIDFVFSGRPEEEFFDMQEYGDYRIFRGLTLVYSRGHLEIMKTVFANNLFNFIWDVISLNTANYDLVISDFEPITAWSTRLKGKPCIALSHQCAFDYDIPKAPGYWGSKQIMKLFAPGKTKVGFHYEHFNQPVLPPLISEIATATATAPSGKILVYMGFETVDDIVSFLSGFSSNRFEVFAKVNERQNLGNITINPLSVEAFHQQLAACDGVISNAGFELSSECLVYGKKLLVKPLSGQYEQLCNIVALKLMGRATVMDCLDRKVLKDWLQKPTEKPVIYPKVADALANWIINPQRGDVETLAKTVWGDYQGLAINNSLGD